MFEYFESEKAKKKAMTSEEKKAAKKVKEEMEAKYTYCLLDGRKEKVGNFRVEPPGLFRGRGEHPKKGALKVSFTSRSRGYRLTDVKAPSQARRYHPQHWKGCANTRSKRSWKMEGHSA